MSVESLSTSVRLREAQEVVGSVSDLSVTGGSVSLVGRSVHGGHRK